VVTKYYDAAGQRMAMRVGGALYFLHGDHLGSATLTTGASGNWVGEARYTPYGEMRRDYPRGVIPTDRLYTGQRQETFGLYDYRARYYHPALGRFISADTLVPNPGNPQDLNRYAYVRNNPLKYTDPSGQRACLDEECHWVEHPVSGKIRWHGSLGEWREAVAKMLMSGGPTCQHAAQYIVDNDVQIGFAEQSHSDARWTLDGRIELDPRRYSMDDMSAELLGAIVHEATHLEQGLFLRLSVEGEVGGWRAEFDARAELEQAGFGLSIDDPHWINIAINVPASPTDRDLRYARSEMREYSPGYLIWLLPLRPEGWLLLFSSPLGPPLAFYGMP